MLGEAGDIRTGLHSKSKMCCALTSRRSERLRGISRLQVIDQGVIDRCICISLPACQQNVVRANLERCNLQVMNRPGKGNRSLRS